MQRGVEIWREVEVEGESSMCTVFAEGAPEYRELYEGRTTEMTEEGMGGKKKGKIGNFGESSSRC